MCVFAKPRPKSIKKTAFGAHLSFFLAKIGRLYKLRSRLFCLHFVVSQKMSCHLATANGVMHVIVSSSMAG